MKLRNNIVVISNILVAAGIFICDKLDYHNYLIFFISISLFLFSAFFLLKKTVYKSISYLLIVTSILLTVGFTQHYLNQKKIYINKNYLNEVIKCKAIVESSSFSNSGNIKLKLKSVYFIINGNYKTKNVDFLGYYDSKDLKIDKNDTIFFKSKLNSFDFYENPWDFDFGKYNERKGIIGYVFLKENNSKIIKGKDDLFDVIKIRNKLNELLKTVLSGQEAEVCKAFLWGDREGVNYEVLDAFVNTGTIHILAVSGLHIGILFTVVLSVFKFFSRWISKKKATIIAIIIAWIYAYISGFSPSILRSVIVFSLIFYNDFSEKRRSELTLMSLSAIIILLYDTNYLFDLGFQLTYAALIGIYVFFPHLKNLFNVKNKFIDYFYSPLMLGVSAQLTTLPIILYNFHQFPNYFTITNILLVPFSFLIITLGVAFYIFSFNTFLKFLFGKALFIVVHFMIFIVDLFDGLPLSVAKQFVFNELDFIVFIFILIFFYFVIIKRNKKLLIIFCFVSLCFCSFIQYKRFLSLSNSYIARIGNSDDLLVKNRSFLYLISSKQNRNDFNVKRIEKHYQSHLKQITIHYNQNILYNKINIFQFSKNEKGNKFQILKK